MPPNWASHQYPKPKADTVCPQAHFSGDVIEPDGGAVAIGSGGAYALAAARALLQHSQLSAREIALEAMRITADICVHTNDQILIEELE